MRGALVLPGNVTPYAEANVANDPEAADLVLRSGLPVRMVGLDVAHQVALTREETAEWRELGMPAGRLFADMPEHYIVIYEQNKPRMGAVPCTTRWPWRSRSTLRLWGACRPTCASNLRKPRAAAYDADLLART